MRLRTVTIVAAAAYVGVVIVTSPVNAARTMVRRGSSKIIDLDALVHELNESIEKDWKDAYR